MMCDELSEGSEEIRKVKERDSYHCELSGGAVNFGRPLLSLNAPASRGGISQAQALPHPFRLQCTRLRSVQRQPQGKCGIPEAGHLEANFGFVGFLRNLRCFDPNGYPTLIRSPSASAIKDDTLV